MVANGLIKYRIKKFEYRFKSVVGSPSVYKDHLKYLKKNNITDDKLIEKIEDLIIFYIKKRQLNLITVPEGKNLWINKIAENISKKSGIEFIKFFKDRETNKKRQLNVRIGEGKKGEGVKIIDFEWLVNRPENKKILLLDDFIWTGQTMINAFNRLLKNNLIVDPILLSA